MTRDQLIATIMLGLGGLLMIGGATILAGIGGAMFATGLALMLVWIA